MVIALNMIDVTRKNGDVIQLKKLGEALGCEVAVSYTHLDVYKRQTPSLAAE